MKLSVVIACHNAAKTLRDCLLSLQSMGRRDLEIIVADDGGTDDSASIALGLGVRVLKLPKVGRAAALNAGIDASRGETVLFTDSDCVVPKTWADRMEELLDEGFDGVGGNLVPSRWNVIETAKVLRYLHEFQDDFILQGSYAGICLNANNMGLRRRVLDRIGGFDPRFIHGADADLTRRLLKADFRLLRTRSIETRHLKVEDLRAFLSTFYGRGTTLRFFMKEDPTMTLPVWGPLVAPFKHLVRDIQKLPAMKRRFPEASASRLIPAPFAHLLADYRALAGQRDYYRKTRAEMGRPG